jgi:hypothetical protein
VVITFIVIYNVVINLFPIAQQINCSIYSLGTFYHVNEQYTSILYVHEKNKLEISTIAIVVVPFGKDFSILRSSVISICGKEYTLKNRSVNVIYNNNIKYIDFSQLEISDKLLIQLIHKNHIDISNIKSKIRLAMNNTAFVQ